MKTNDNLSSELKMRVSNSQKLAITQAAKSHNMTKSDFLRNIIFEPSTLSSYAVTIRNNLVKNELYNRIQASNEIPKRYKELIYKEIDKID